MNKKKLHDILKILHKTSYWYFLAAFLVSGLVAIMALRHNNLTALGLRNEVLQTDKDNGNTEAALKKLREYVYSHMNTNLASGTSVYPPIQLKYRYERLVQAEKDKVAAANSNTYNDAQNYCEKNFPQSFYGAGRLPCIQNYLDTHPYVQPQTKPIPDSLYKFDFASPVWSPDLAGLSLVVTALFFVLFVVRFALERWMHAKLKHHL
ncbi:MAG TPA: hypothetical protein VM124_00380 [Candidatus Limnocylindrales bacterium]|nr:hypothetical protein [Candidatus Limnocylindrales bacterium]